MAHSKFETALVDSKPLGTRSNITQELESLRVLVGSIGGEPELGPLLGRILRHACELIGAEDGTIGLVGETRTTVRTEAAYAMPASELGTHIAKGIGLSGEVLRTGAAVLSARYGDLPGTGAHPMADNSVIGVPITWKGDLIGVFGLGRAPHREGDRIRHRPFSLKHVAALEVFANHAAVAVENARRLHREKHRAERYALIARVGQLVAADLRPMELLQAAADAIHSLLGYENIGIPLMDPDDASMFVLRTFGGSYKDIVAGEHRIPISTGIMGAAARSRQTVLVNDVAADPRYLPTPGIVQVRAELAVPILLGNRLLGVLNVEGLEPFDEEDAAGLRVVADQLAVALENARLHEAAQGAAVLEERHRLARELHDSVTQQLFSAMLMAQAVGPAYASDRKEGERRIGLLLDLQRSALREMRALLAELRPLRTVDASIGELSGIGLVRRDGLVAALRAHCASATLAVLKVTVVDGGYAPQSAAREEALYRVAQEALHNAMKHARATEAVVTLQSTGGVARLSVRDNGMGFDQSMRITGEFSTGGLGLVSMRERAAEHGGALRIDSAAGNGTMIEITLPLVADGAA